MKPELSIIIPCYNCEKTLREAVTSCFVQNLASFEIVMVDDGSTDGTHALMKTLAGEYPEILIFKQEQNLGGGAARNRAVQESLSERIFCLDSDDLLPPNTLPPMLALMREKECDGIVFEGGLSFSKTPDRHTKRSFGIDPTRPISLSDIIAGKPAGVTANFLYTKKAHAAAGGYPIHHNFDTQGFGARFLAKGLVAHVCPNAYFLQRQFASKLSYFERAYNSGEFSVGYFFIFLDIIELLSPEATRTILDFDIFGMNRLGEKNIQSALTTFYSAHSDAYLGDRRSTDPLTLRLSRANTLMREGKRDEALSAFHGLISEGSKLSEQAGRNIKFIALHIITTEGGQDRRVSVTRKVMRGMLPTEISADTKRPGIVTRAIRKLKRTL